jgi:hypothetical protein
MARGICEDLLSSYGVLRYPDLMIEAHDMTDETAV